MCETTIKLRKKGQLQTLAEDVLFLEVTPEGLTCRDALGEEKFLKGVKIVSANFSHPHELIVEPLENS